MEKIKQMTVASTTLSNENISLIKNDESTFFVPQPGTISSGNYTLPRKVLSKRLNKSKNDQNLFNESSHKRQNYLIQNRKHRASFYDNANKPIFISKCICFVTRGPIVYSIENLLRSIYLIINNKFNYLSSKILPIESIIYWSLHEVFFI